MKNRNKIATDLEQSKKLLELGIDADTADMFYEKMDDEEFDYHKLCVGKISKPLIEDFGYIPAWSLSALWEILDPIVVAGKIEFQILNENDVWKYHVIKYFHTPHGPVKVVDGNSRVDAVFEMIVYLKENKLI